MYLPSPSGGDNIFTYDVNSLYPFVMANLPMPVGKIRFFEGNILDVPLPQFSPLVGSSPSPFGEGAGGYFAERKGDQANKPFGFFEVEITTPTDLKIPIILTRVTKKGQTSTMAPLGA
jgi:hypothetical protein